MQSIMKKENNHRILNIGVDVLLIAITAVGSFQNGWLTAANLVSWLGLIGVVGLAKRWKGNFYFNALQNFSAFLVANKAKLFGDAAMSLFYLTSQFYGIVNWSKNVDAEGKVKVERETNWRLVAFAILIGFFLLGGMSWYLGGAFILLDAFNNATAIVAQVLQMRRVRASWLLWLLTNVIGIVIWLGVGVPQMALMYFVFSLNAGRGYLNWGNN